MKKILVFIFLLPFWLSCDSANPPKPAGEVHPPVSVAKVTRQTVPIKLTAIGTVEASATVEIKARVDGQLTKVHFSEGQEVKAGDMLFTIDPAPYQAALKEAVSRLASDKAQTEKAQTDLNRYAELVRNKVISAADFEQYSTNAQVRRSIQAATEAEVENAKLALGWCYIKAPISGPTGVIQFHAGNLVNANADKPLLVIQQVRPIDVSFTLPELYLSAARQMKSEVQALIPGREGSGEKGVINFVDNTVNTATGTILLKARFANENKALWPGQFVSVSLTTATISDALLVPDSAIQTGPGGKRFVFMLDKQQQLQIREVTPGPALDNQFTVILSGLEEGGIVVSEGQLRLSPETRQVSIRNPEVLQ